MLICTTTEKSCFWPDRERLINDVIIKKISSSFSNNNQTWIVTDAAEWMWRWPASAQQSCLLWGSKVRALGSPSPSCTSTVLSLPSKPERSILGPSRFQSDQYRYLEDRETCVIHVSLEHRRRHKQHGYIYSNRQQYIIWLLLCRKYRQDIHEVDFLCPLQDVHYIL